MSDYELIFDMINTKLSINEILKLKNEVKRIYNTKIDENTTDQYDSVLYDLKCKYEDYIINQLKITKLEKYSPLRLECEVIQFFKRYEYDGGGISSYDSNALTREIIKYIQSLSEDIGMVDVIVRKYGLKDLATCSMILLIKIYGK